MRAVVDAVCGAIIVCVIAVGFVGLMALLGTSLDTADGDIRLRRLPFDLRLATIAGLVVGALAGLSTRLTNGQVSFVRNIMVIGGIAIVVRLFAFPKHKGADFFLTDLATVIAAIIAAMFVVGWNRVRPRAATDTPSNSRISPP